MKFCRDALLQWCSLAATHSRTGTPVHLRFHVVTLSRTGAPYSISHKRRHSHSRTISSGDAVNLRGSHDTRSHVRTHDLTYTSSQEETFSCKNALTHWCIHDVLHSHCHVRLHARSQTRYQNPDHERFKRFSVNVSIKSDRKSMMRVPRSSMTTFPIPQSSYLNITPRLGRPVNTSC